MENVEMLEFQHPLFKFGKLISVNTLFVCQLSCRNIAGGTIMSGFVGLFFRVVLGHKAWLARPLAVATSVSVLALTATPFPPGVYAPCNGPAR